MIDFHFAQLEEKPEIDRILAGAGEMGCDYSFTNLYAWVESYVTKIAVVCGCVTARFADGIYLCPVGEDVRGAVLEIQKDASERGTACTMVCSSKHSVEKLQELFPDSFSFTPDRNGFDYIYSIEKLATLAGRKMSKKRNHIHHFEAQNADWSFEPIGPANMQECREMDRAWFQEEIRFGENATLDGDNTALARCFDSYEELGMEGGALRVNGRIVAFTLGSILPCGNVMDVHFEKAYASVDGAYPMINREFSKYIREKYPQIEYMNREDDLGLEGLRHAKESYYPEILLEKYSARPLTELR